MVSNYWRVKREGMFPEIKDWTLDYNELRFKRNVKEMSWGNWFWFSTSSYKLIHFGSNVVTAFLFIGLILLSTYLNFPWLSPVFGLIAAYYLWNLAVKIKKREMVKYLNFYDIFLREDKNGN